MDTTRIDAVARCFGSTLTRREAMRALIAGAAALTAGGILAGGDVVARKKRRAKKRKQTFNVCEGRNWCVDRTQTCGPEGGYGKCLIATSGRHICAELLFQVASCTECEAPNCIDCHCVPAEGGDDRCNNGAAGLGFICVRKV